MKSISGGLDILQESLRRFYKGRTQIIQWNNWFLRSNHLCGRRTEEKRLHGIQDGELHYLMKPGFNILTVSNYNLYSVVTMGFELSDWSFQKVWMLDTIVWTARSSCLAFWLEAKWLSRIARSPWDAIDEHQHRRSWALHIPLLHVQQNWKLSIQTSVIWKETQQIMKQESILNYFQLLSYE